MKRVSNSLLKLFIILGVISFMTLPVVSDDGQFEEEEQIVDEDIEEASDEDMDADIEEFSDEDDDLMDDDGDEDDDDEEDEEAIMHKGIIICLI